MGCGRRCRWCRRGGCSARTSGHRVAGVCACPARWGNQCVIELSPVAWLDVLPGLVVGEGGGVAQRWRSRLGIFCLAAGGLGQHTKRQAQHQCRCQAVGELVHCSKPCEEAGGCQQMPMPARSARTSPIGPLAEASRGQMVRGGRSWPPDWKVGAGATMSGNPAALSSTGAPSPAEALGTGGTEHDAEHMLHLSGLNACAWSAAFASWVE